MKWMPPKWLLMRNKWQKCKMFLRWRRQWMLEYRCKYVQSHPCDHLSCNALTLSLCFPVFVLWLPIELFHFGTILLNYLTNKFSLLSFSLLIKWVYLLFLDLVTSDLISSSFGANGVICLLNNSNISNADRFLVLNFTVSKPAASVWKMDTNHWKGEHVLNGILLTLRFWY